jgi:hypothetical protein
MPGSHDEAGSPIPLTKAMRCFSGDDDGLIAGKKVQVIGEDGLLGIIRDSEDGRFDSVLDAMIAEMFLRGAGDFLISSPLYARVPRQFEAVTV